MSTSLLGLGDLVALAQRLLGDVRRDPISQPTFRQPLIFVAHFEWLRYVADGLFD